MVADLAPLRDDLRNQSRYLTASTVCGSASKDNRPIRVSARDHTDDPKAKLAAAADPTMVVIVTMPELLEAMDDQAILIIRHFNHFQELTGQFVAISFLRVSLAESSKLIRRP